MMQRADAPILRDLSMSGFDNAKIVKNANESNKFTKMIKNKININDDGNDCEIEMFPTEMSDLFIGSSVINAGKYHCLNKNSKYQFPQSVTISGLNIFDKRISYKVKSETNTSLIPIDRVFIKERIDQLTAQQWLSQNNSLKNEIIETSIGESFPSMYTSMVAVELTKQEKEELNNQRQQNIRNQDLQNRTV